MCAFHERFTAFRRLRSHVDAIDALDIRAIAPRINTRRSFVMSGPTVA
jgi:hypothetical protein